MNALVRWFDIENLDEIPSPALLLFVDHVQENIRRMIKLVGSVDKLRPHVKTHKTPQIVKLQLAQQITKFKASTIAEAEMVAAVGGRDILLAYQPVGPNIARFMALQHAFPESRFSCLVDNISTFEQLDQWAQRTQQKICVFVDLDVGMGRTGISVGSLAIKLCRAILQSSHVELLGFHAYDGHLKNRDHDLLKRQVASTFEPVWELVDELKRLQVSNPLVIAGGTPTSPILAAHRNVEVGMGTPVLWDYGQSQVCPEQNFLWAAVLLARVVSRPSANRLCIDLGYKSVASEMPQPRVQFLNLEDATIVMHSEEHLVLETERALEFSPGSPIFAIPHHICPTVALHEAFWVVRDNAVIDTWAIEARHRRLHV